MIDDPIAEAEVASAWDRNADRWTASVRAGFDVYRELYTLPAFLDFIPPLDGLRVIDLGCGEGSNTRRFAALGGQVTGVDLSSSMIAKAREAEIREPLGIRYEVCSYSRLEPFEPESFDCALSTMALMDSPDFAAAVRATCRVLVPGGRLCFSILHPCFITPLAEWIRSPEGSCTALKVGRYFDASPFVERWRFSKHPAASHLEPFEVPRFPRTLSDYLNAICIAGLRITGIEEPRPGEALSREHAWLARWREHAPLALLVAAVKA